MIQNDSFASISARRDKRVLPCVLWLCCIAIACSCDAAQPPWQRLWEADAPGATGDAAADVPLVQVHLPKSSSPTAALVILPGGGYGHLAMDHEGQQIAQWANKNSLAGIIVSYRHRGRGYGHPAPMLDAQRAMRTVRARAAQWNINPQQVGVIGFSAGGHLASTLVTHFDTGEAGSADPVQRQSSRPDFGILCYPVICLGQPHTHRGSQHNLLGKSADKKLIESLSGERQVTAATPPCFVWHTASDQVVDVKNSLAFYSALVEHGEGSELHVFPRGRHGLGLAREVAGAQAWPGLAMNWVQGVVESH